MNWDDTPEQAAFRAEVQRFIRERFPPGYLPDAEGEASLEPEDVYGFNWAADRRSDDPERRAAALSWARALAEKGWVAPHWPQKYGGAGLDIFREFILHEEMMRAGVPTVNGIGAFLLGPTLLRYGDEIQRRAHLPRISAGEEVWAQGFSEPDAGSDLAALRTRAVRDGDHYVVNGQKVWTSLAQHADWLFALVRTDPKAPKHRGITFLMIDLASPGVAVRPIEDMRGDHPFAEVFLENVRVPTTNRVGEENHGWRVAMATLDFERSGIGATIKCEQALNRLIRFIHSDEGKAYLRSDWRQSVRHEIAERYIEIRVLYNLALSAASKSAAGETASDTASINRLFGAAVYQRLARTGAKAFGVYGNLWQRKSAPLGAHFTRDCAAALAQSFLAGSSEIQRNVIATRGLGLPRE
ncbi:MAG: acyl-CoA dehydrogenase family protein [Parvularculaceae bacterium]